MSLYISKMWVVIGHFTCDFNMYMGNVIDVITFGILAKYFIDMIAMFGFKIRMENS